MTIDSESPNPNYKIHKGQRAVANARRLPFKVMWFHHHEYTPSTLQYVYHSCAGRLFKTEKVAAAFAYRLLMEKKARKVFVYRWDYTKDEWVDNQHEA